MGYIPEKCKNCHCIGDYTSGPYARNPHYCCELIYRLTELDYKVNPDTRDEKCPLPFINFEKISEMFGQDSLPQY